MQIDVSEHELGLMIDMLKEKWSDLRVQVRRAETGTYHEELRTLERAAVDLLNKLERVRSGAAQADGDRAGL
jgi:hypothetical protein